MLASNLKSMVEDGATKAGKEAMAKASELCKKVVADLTTRMEANVKPVDVALASRTRKAMFRYNPPAQYLLGPLTREVAVKQIGASVHEYLGWMQTEQNLELKTSVAYCISAFERATFRCLRQRRCGLFTFPALHLLVRINPQFACNFCGNTDVPEKEQYLCLKCESSMSCPSCRPLHTDDFCRFSQQSVNPEMRKHLSNCAICSGCGKEDAQERYNLCSGCRTARYCSRACQVTDWRAGHRHECNIIARLPASSF